MAAIAVFFVGSDSVAAQERRRAPARGWEKTKHIAANIIYKGVEATFYCGCSYSLNDSYGGGGSIIDDRECGYEGPDQYSAFASRIEWEHIVPAALTPARNFPCWDGKDGRKRCASEDPKAQAILFDLHNLAPSIGQVNALRGNDRYRNLGGGGGGDTPSDFGACEIIDEPGAFEPPDCKKGDVARVWFYMRDQHSVVLDSDEQKMFAEWAAADPVSPWESEREQRIFKQTGKHNRHVFRVTPHTEGSCSWEWQPGVESVSNPLSLYDDNGNGRITCGEARAHGIAPVGREHPAYQYMRDADGDGVVCE